MSTFRQTADRLKKPIKRSTAKAKKDTVKRVNIGLVRDHVEQRDGERCRIATLLARFGFTYAFERLELAHIAARGMGGNPDLSRDTTQNTLLVSQALHNGGKYSLHGEYLEIEPLTDQGADGPVKVTFYEKLPSEVR